MAFIGTFSRALLESATAVYFGGASVSILDAQGNVILGDDLPEAPTVTSTIADRTYTVGDAAVTVDLRTKFSGATSYTVSPSSPAVSIDGYTLTINPIAAMTATTFTVRGINGGGPSTPLTFTLTVTAPLAVLLKPFPDQSLLIGGGTVTLPLAEYFSGAVGYAVSPANSGVTISNGNLVISRTTARDVIITVTATNSTGQDTSDSFALLVSAPANQAPVASAIPQQTPTANTAFTADLSSYFVDPEGAALSFDYTGTLPTGITRNGAVFSGTATVTDQTASGVLRARDPGNLEAEAPVTWAVAAQPTLQATITPDPPVAGQPASVTFNTAIDGPPTIAQGQTAITATRVGQTNEWTFTPSTTEPVTIGATKAGYTSFSQVYDVQPARPDIIVTSANTAQFVNVDASTPAFDLTMTGPYAGTRTVTPSQMAAGPIAHVAPSQTGTAAVGETVTLDPGFWLNFASAGQTVLEYELRSGTDIVQGVNGLSYTVQASDQGKSLVWHVTGSDQNGDGAGPVASNAIAIPAAPGLANGVTPVGLYKGQEGGTSASTRSTAIQVGPADAGKTLYMLVETTSSINSGKVIVGGTEYPITKVQDQTVSGGTRLALLSAAVPVGGAGTLEVSTTGSMAHAPNAYVLAAKGVTMLTPYRDAATMTAGTAMPRGVGTTQVGDHMVYAILSAPYSASGVFDSAVGVTELVDEPLRSSGPQLWVGLGVETVAGTRTLNVTPNASGNAARMSVVFRSA